MNSQKLVNPFLKSSPFSSSSVSESHINSFRTSNMNTNNFPSSYQPNYGYNKEIPTHDSYNSINNRNLGSMHDDYRNRQRSSSSRIQTFNKNDLSSLLDNNPFKKSTVRQIQPQDQYINNSYGKNINYQLNSYDNKYNYDTKYNKANYYTNYQPNSSNYKYGNQYGVNFENKYDNTYNNKYESNYNKYENNYNNNLSPKKGSSVYTCINKIKDEDLVNVYNQVIAQQSDNNILTAGGYLPKNKLVNSVTYKANGQKINQKDTKNNYINSQFSRDLGENNNFKNRNKQYIDNNYQQKIQNKRQSYQSVAYDEFASMSYQNEKNSHTYRFGEINKSVDEVIKEQMKQGNNFYRQSIQSASCFANDIPHKNGQKYLYQQSKQKKNQFNYCQNSENFEQSLDSKHNDLFGKKQINTIKQPIVQFDDYQEQKWQNKNYNTNYCQASKQAKFQRTDQPKIIEVQGMLYHFININ